MTRTETNRYRKTLEMKRRELLREIAARRERLALDPMSDPMDQIRSLGDRDVVLGNVTQMYRVLRGVEGALSEIREGTFGVCAECGNDIPSRRLEAVPWSPYCVACQERAEQAEYEQDVAETRVGYRLAS